MSSTTAPEQTTTSTKEKVAVAWQKHGRKVLAVTTVASTVAAITMRTGIAQHNAFLKEHGLYEQFYDIATPAIES